MNEVQYIGRSRRTGRQLGGGPSGRGPDRFLALLTAGGIGLGLGTIVVILL